jgi:hypothetical protein
MRERDRSLSHPRLILVVIGPMIKNLIPMQADNTTDPGIKTDFLDAERLFLSRSYEFAERLPALLAPSATTTPSVLA